MVRAVRRAVIEQKLFEINKKVGLQTCSLIQHEKNVLQLQDASTRRHRMATRNGGKEVAVLPIGKSVYVNIKKIQQKCPEFWLQ